MRDHILNEIRRLAALNAGRPPGQKFFAAETGILDRQWRGRFWARWSDALVEAGFQPNALNKRLDSGSVLAAVVLACRHFGKLPTGDEIEMYRRSCPSVPHPNVIRTHFGSRSGLIAALRKRTEGDQELSDVAAMLPTEPPAAIARPGRAAEGYVYLMESGGYHKIGRSDDIERRVRQIRVALPDKATLVHTIKTDDPAGVEGYWHNRFKDKRANGEWFKLSSSDLLAFKRRKFQ
jgi:Meiotically up-regulated gene 113